MLNCYGAAFPIHGIDTAQKPASARPQASTNKSIPADAVFRQLLHSALLQEEDDSFPNLPRFKQHLHPPHQA